ncbi:MAG: Crp/Fnr family transcriptional regulator [Rhizobiales bacterium]|nr:Crp/Fnr family transcriptional regulator [Hyphomicrobiales bacterium]
MENLSQIQLFADISPESDTKYAKICSWKEYGENELVIDIDDNSTEVRFIISGSARVISRIAVGKDVILGELGEGQFFGEMAAIDGFPRSANVTTLTKTRICTMPATVFRQILEENPQISVKVMKLLVKLIRSLNERLAEHSFLQAKHRLYSELLRLSKVRVANKTHRIVSPPPTQREIAERIGSRREVVSRELNVLEKQGHIEKTRGGIIIINVQELQNRISKGWED